MSEKTTTEDTLNQQEAEHAIKNYSRVPNMLVDGYNELHPQDKWLWVCLVRLCGKDRTRFLSLRYISKRTGFTPSVLSDNKKDGKPGMIRRLHNAGVIHAEIKRKKLADGSETGNEQYHITITDTWALNYAFYNKSTCSESEQDIDEDSQPVRNQNKSVRNQNGNSQTRTETEQACSDSSTNLRLHSKTTDSNKITEEESNTDQSQNGNDSPNGDSSLIEALEEERERNQQLEKRLAILEAKLSTQAQQFPTSNTQDNTAVVGGNLPHQGNVQDDKPTTQEAAKQPSYSQPATQIALPNTPAITFSEQAFKDMPVEAKRGNRKIDPTVERVKWFYDTFTALGVKFFEDDTFKADYIYGKTDPMYKLIATYISEGVSPLDMRMAFEHMWNEEREDGQHFWQNPDTLTNRAFCKNFRSKLASAKFKIKQARRKEEEEESKKVNQVQVRKTSPFAAPDFYEQRRANTVGI